jgi:hypothetical protein
MEEFRKAYAVVSLSRLAFAAYLLHVFLRNILAGSIPVHPLVVNTLSS